MDCKFPLHQLKQMYTPPTFLTNIISNLQAQSGIVTTSKHVGSSNGYGGGGGGQRVSWRDADIKYASNEIYFDITEDLDCTYDKNFNLISGFINGTIKCKSRLSGNIEKIM